MKEYTACFSGHRAIETGLIPQINSILYGHIKTLIKKGITLYISGGARGFDLISGVCILELKKEYPHIKLCMALPCRKQTKGWNGKDVAIYQYVLDNADEVKYISEEYTDRCMFDRNDYMVENSGHCICYLTRQRGGTAYTVRRAKQAGLSIFNVGCLL